MDWIRLTIARRLQVCLVVASAVGSLPTVAIAQVRTKVPDRGVYQSPRLTPTALETSPADGVSSEADFRSPSNRPLQAVDHQEVLLAEPQTSEFGSVIVDGHAYVDESPWYGDEVIHDSTCDGCGSCCNDGCDAVGCDSLNCVGTHGRLLNSSVCFSRDRWFGSAELLLMFRKGDQLPPLVTTGPSTDADTAGELGQADTEVLVGGETVLKDMTAGGRLTLGTWLDDAECRSLVFRGWIAGEETFEFHSDQDENPVLARPFLDVSAVPSEQNTNLVAFPDRSTGSIDISASSKVFGGDVSVRQFWYGRFGGTVDLLYGYQYMRLDEDLGITCLSTSLDDNFAPLGSILSTSDSFEAENEFHGGQFGIASRYREGCWSFHSLAKVGFGSLRRSATLSGSTFTSVDGNNAVDPNGLLVRETNAGTITNHTFGWVPELDLSLGWHRFPCYDVTFGYHIVAMTDALQTSDMIDPDLAVNLSDPLVGQQSPSASLRYETFYVQGIHFGLQYVY